MVRSARREVSVGWLERFRVGPFREGAFPSPLHDERSAGILGIALGVSFSVCFLTGLISHLLQHPQPWFHWPARPVNLYRITQGAHVMTGIASIPLLLAKLWVVYPRFWAWPPFQGVVQGLERLSLLPLIGGALFLLFTGVINIAYYYTPMPFFFPAAHFWAAWLTIGALLVHVGAKLTTTRRTVFAPPTAVAVEEGDLSRRGFLATVVVATGAVVLSVVGETLRPLNRLALLAPRRPAVGPQGLPVNRTAAEAGIYEAAVDPGYRLLIEGGGHERPVGWSLGELRAMPQREAGLPIACVEGWSASARWRGVSLRHLLDQAGVPPEVHVRVESLEQGGLYTSSVVDPEHLADPDTLVALELNGAPLDIEHGFPARLIAPNRPGVLQTKWLARVVVL